MIPFWPSLLWYKRALIANARRGHHMKVMKLFMLVFLASSLNIHASTELETAFTDLNYALTVEWDQEDQNFYHSELCKFQKIIKEHKDMGVTDQEIFRIALKNIHDQKLAIELFQGLETDQISIEDIFQNTQMRGASWNGRTTIAVVSVAVVIVIVWQVYRAYEYQREGWNVEIK